MSLRTTPILLACLTLTPLIAQDHWEKVRSIAQSQHEIVMLLIEEQQFDKVPDAAKEIFALDFPREQQPLLVEEARLLTDALLHQNQTGVAHKVLDSAIVIAKTNWAKAELLREKAYVFKKEGKTDEAMQTFQQSVELEKKGDS